jgi:fumarylacetoacetate (FAA) hydrolase
MKLASLKEGGRDGTLIVVSRDLTKAVKVPQFAKTMQQLMDEWDILAPKLESVSDALNAGEAANTFDLDVTKLAAPLPRAYQWADGSAYVNHVELVRKARGAEMPPSFWEDPLMYQGGSDHFLGANDVIEMADTAWGIDFESEVAIITDDVPMGVAPEQAGQHIKLLMLVNDVSLRNLIPAELAKGFGFFQSKPASAFSPVAVTPDELGDAWDGGKVCLPLVTHINDELFGEPDAGVDMTFDFTRLIAHAARTRYLGAGAVIGSGTVSNLDRSSGSSCLAEKRMLEVIEHGEAKTPFLQFGDRVAIEMLDKEGRSIFGRIHQEVVEYKAVKKAA